MYYTTFGIITPVGGRPVHRLREDFSGIITPIGGRPVHRLREDFSGIITPIGVCPVHRLREDCIVQFWPPDDEHVCSKHVEA